MRNYARGILLGTITYTKGVPGSFTAGGTGISRDYTYTDPVSTKRRRPAATDLIWSGQAYSKSWDAAYHNQMSYLHDISKKGDFFTNYTLNLTSSSAVCSRPSGLLLSAPVDPMNKLLGKLRSNVANIGTMLGEYKSTASLVSSTGTKILRSIQFAKRGQIVPALRQLKMVIPTKTFTTYGPVTQVLRKTRASGQPNLNRFVFTKRSLRITRKRTRVTGVDYPAAWLQYKLGLAPLLGDIQLLVDELSSSIKAAPPVTQKVIVTSRTWLQETKTLSRNRFADCKIEKTRQLIAYVQIDNLQLKAMQDHGLTNPLSLLWELTWLSFVVDYVYNVSEWLQALDQPYIFTRSICYDTQRTREEYDSYAVGDYGLGSPGYPVKGLGGARSRYESYTTNRTVRPLTATKPQWKPSGGFQRLVTLSALAVSIGRK